MAPEKKKKATAAELRVRRDKRRERSPRGRELAPPGSATPTRNPLLTGDMLKSEITATERQMRAAARAIDQQQVGSAGQTIESIEGAKDMSIDAIAGRFRKHIDTAVEDARSHFLRTGELALPANMSWYGEHRYDLKTPAKAIGTSIGHSIAAGATASPQNDPKLGELRAVERYSSLHGNDEYVDVTPQASAHVLAAQTKPNAQDKKRQANPTIIPAGRHRIRDLTPHAVAMLGSISGARYKANADEKSAFVGSDEAVSYGFDNGSLSDNEYLHSGLEALRPLGALRNRHNVEKMVNILREDPEQGTWDQQHPVAMDQPSKITSYALTINAADEIAMENQQHNALVHMYFDDLAGPDDSVPLKIPFGQTDTSAQDFWQKEAALGVTYKKGVGPKNPGKPAAAAWDAKIKKTGMGADIQKDSAVHAVLNEAQRRSLEGTPFLMGPGQAITWAGIRETNERGERMSPERPLPHVEKEFLSHFKQFQESPAPSRRDTFHQAAGTKSPAKDPNQMGLF